MDQFNPYGPRYVQTYKIPKVQSDLSPDIVCLLIGSRITNVYL